MADSAKKPSTSDDRGLGGQDLDKQVREAMSKAADLISHGGEAEESGATLMRLQIAHSLSLALSDSVAQTRRLQSLALAGQAAAQRTILEGGDADSARQAAELGHHAVEDSTKDTLELARAALSLFEQASSDKNR